MPWASRRVSLFARNKSAQKSTKSKRIKSAQNRVFFIGFASLVRVLLVRVEINAATCQSHDLDTVNPTDSARAFGRKIPVASCLPNIVSVLVLNFQIIRD